MKRPTMYSNNNEKIKSFMQNNYSMTIDTNNDCYKVVAVARFSGFGNSIHFPNRIFFVCGCVWTCGLHQNVQPKTEWCPTMIYSISTLLTFFCCNLSSEFIQLVREILYDFDICFGFGLFWERILCLFWMCQKEKYEYEFRFFRLSACETSDWQLVLNDRPLDRHLALTFQSLERVRDSRGRIQHERDTYSNDTLTSVFS